MPDHDTTPTRIHPIHRVDLLDAMKVPARIPADWQVPWTFVRLRNRYTGAIRDWCVMLRPASADASHRLRVKCPACGLDLPAGRVAQHFNRVHAS